LHIATVCKIIKKSKKQQNQEDTIMNKFCMGCMTQYENHQNICPACGYIEGTKPKEALHMEPGSILYERYIVGQSLGFGGFGVTYIGWDALLEQKVAIKEYLPSEFATRVPGNSQITVYSGDKYEQFSIGLTRFIDEAQRLAKFHQEEGVVRIFDSFEDNNTAYIIMEYLQGETLAQYLKRETKMPADKAIAILMPVIKSLQMVNARGILHRDIAPDNIFLTSDGNIKLIDFGAARFATTSHSRSLTVIIKPGYSPEEQYRSRGDQGAHTDVYAIGATLYRMVTGQAPPDAMERRAFFEGKQKDILKPIRKFTNEITDNQETAILNALNVRIEDRTPNMVVLAQELTTVEPEKVKRLYGKIKRIDVLKWPLWARISAPAAMLALFVVSALFAFGVIGFAQDLQTAIDIPDGMSRVPSIVNNDMQQASERLYAVTLQYSIVGRSYSEQVPANLVLTQNINAGLIVESNTIIDLTISSGAEMETVPDVTGLNIEDAQRLLTEAGFAVLVINEYSDIFAVDSVIYQDVAAGVSLAIGSPITLTVSQGINPYEAGEQRLSTIPDLVGMSIDSALLAAGEAGFMVAVRSREYSYQFDMDIVMFQDLQPGTEVMSGNTIEIIVSLGVQIITVPELQFRPEGEAAQLLENLGLIVNITHAYSETVASGLVISQTPPPGTTVEPGDVVNIVVSAGGESFAMPNVVGMTEAVATSTITSRGLSVAVEFERNDNVPEGNVIRQSIASGTMVSRGRRVTITVSSGQNLIQVANVVGRPQSEAGNTLRGQGFNVTVSEAASETVAQGIVISQSLTAGSSQVSGANIIITVSTGVPMADVPNVVGRTQSAAESTLRNAGFTVTVTSAVSATVPSGSVVSQTPTGGSAARGSAVAIVVSTGPENVSVANVVGNSRANAESALRGQGLTVTVVEVFHETVARGNVISQTPVAGTSVAPGSAVTINVSRGNDTVSSIAIRTTPSRTVYNVGDTLNTAGLSLDVTWASGDRTVVTSGFTATPTVLSTQGTQVITVSFGGRNATFSVTVNVAHIPVTNITDVPTTATARTPLTLTGTVAPANATNRVITWSVVNAGTTGAAISGNTLNTTAAGTVTIMATVANGTALNVNFTRNFTITVAAGHIPVTNITGAPTTAIARTPLQLTGTVNPANATNRTITWSVVTAGTTGASISGNTLTTTAAGSVTIMATVVGGTAPNVNYTQSFTVMVAAGHIPVTNITGVPTTAIAGRPIALAGWPTSTTVNPANATNREITWSVASAGTTGASISGNTLYTTAEGTVTITATIANGTAPGVNYTQNFNVIVSPEHIRVTSITLTNIIGAQLVFTKTAGTPVTLTGIVSPSNATNRDITWSVINAGTTGATISGNILNTTATGTATIMATVINGLGPNSNFITSAITVTVNPAGVAVPNVVGMTRANAEAAIRNAGFAVGTVTEANNDIVAAGNVISQNPNAGTTQNAGTVVNFVVSRGPVHEPFTVTASYIEQPLLFGMVRKDITATTSINATSVTVSSRVGNTTYGPFNMHSGNSRNWLFAATFFTPGMHTLTVTARTADNRTATATITINIVIAQAPTPAPTPVPVVEAERLNWQRTRAADFLITNPTPGANQNFTVRLGEVLSIPVTTNIPTNYPSDRYILWGAFTHRSPWIGERSMFINRGNLTTYFVIDTSQFDFLEVGTFNFAFAIFHPDRFAQGQSLQDSRIRITVTA